MWGEKTLGLPIHDNWWQTETGAIMISNFAAMDIRPGSMGRPLPGVTAAVLRRGQDGRAQVTGGQVSVITEPGAEGELALRPGWPSMFRGYLHDPERYAEAFAGGWYLTGDLVRRDADGYYWFVARADDVIKSAGHLIGPFEVESVLMEHPAVAEAGVIGKPDPVAGEIVKAFVALKPGREAERRLAPRAAGVRPPQARARSHRRKSSSTRTCRSHTAGRSCGGCSRPGNSGWNRGHLDPGECPVSPRQRPASTNGPAAHHTDLLRQMLLIRRFEEKCVELYSAGEIRGFVHLYIGEEAVAVGVNQALTPDDAVVSTYREHGHALVRGIGVTAVMAEMYGKATGCSGGRGGSMHLFDATTRFYGGNAIVGGGLPLAVGIALADKMRGRSRVTACFFGDGAVAEGEFHECLNLAALWQLPVLFCCENNLYAMGTALDRAQAQTDLAVRAASYGMPAWAVDGMDVLAVEQAARHAAETVRGGGGPHFLELRTYRFRAHSMYDPDRYRDKAEVEEWKQRDPIDALAARMREAGELTDDTLAAIDADLAGQIDDAIEKARGDPLEAVSDLTRFVYSPRQP